MLGEFRYDDPSHTYWFGDRKVPGTTTVIGKWRDVRVGGYRYWIDIYSGAVVPGPVFEAARDFGSAVHLGARFELVGQHMDWALLPPDVAAALGHLMRWVEDYSVRVLWVERPMGDHVNLYGGTPDIFCHIQGSRWPFVIDIKTGDVGLVEVQLASYENLIRVNDRVRAKIGRAALKLTPEGYKFQEVGLPTDFAWFKAMLMAYRYHNQKEAA